MMTTATTWLLVLLAASSAPVGAGSEGEGPRGSGLPCVGDDLCAAGEVCAEDDDGRRRCARPVSPPGPEARAEAARARRADAAYPPRVFNGWTVGAAALYGCGFGVAGTVMWAAWALSGLWDLRALLGGVALCGCGCLGAFGAVWLLRGVVLREAIRRGVLEDDPMSLPLPDPEASPEQRY